MKYKGFLVFNIGCIECGVSSKSFVSFRTASLLPLLALLLALYSCAPDQTCFDQIQELEASGCPAAEATITCAAGGTKTSVECGGYLYLLDVPCETGQDGYPMTRPEVCWFNGAVGRTQTSAGEP